MKPVSCRNCHEDFVPYQGKPGYVNQCTACANKMARAGKDVEPLGGNMIFDHKTAPYIEVKPINKARDFARKTRRLGFGVTRCITQTKEPGFGEADRDSNVIGTEYRTRLGEARKVK